MTAMAVGFMGGNTIDITPGPRGDIFYPGSFCDFGSGLNIGQIEYARRHNRRGKIVRRNRGY